ncbi:hypothetical protein [Lysobacter sp. Root690]|uniref:hypothetical protein n=1 Tax=Lysobacter sp. Root690 TaxID=1736588 RepID=UPI00138ED6DA|nr:hypothetical protein [Lysobacter sp. Root690]
MNDRGGDRDAPTYRTVDPLDCIRLHAWPCAAHEAAAELVHEIAADRKPDHTPKGRPLNFSVQAAAVSNRASPRRHMPRAMPIHRTRYLSR